MIDAQLVDARKPWGVLAAKLTSLGWKDRGIKLAIFEAYVHAVLLYGSSLWGMRMLDPTVRVVCNYIGELGAFYRSCTQTLLGVSLEPQNSITYVPAEKQPLSVYITKSVRQNAQCW